MCLITFNLYFHINYKCEYGYSIYVIGNSKSLGAWKPEKAIRLNWSEGHNWQKNVLLTLENQTNIQFKFIIAPSDDSSNPSSIIWERGPNSILNLKTQTELAVQIEHEWEKQTVYFALKDDILSSPSFKATKVFLFQDRGSPIIMKQRKISIIGTTNPELYWIGKISANYYEESINYWFQVIDGSKKLILYDPQKRKCILSKFNFQPQTLEPSSYQIIGDKKIKVHNEIFLTLNYDKISEDIYVGSQIQDHEDIMKIKKEGITAVINLQNDEDLKRMSMDWEGLKKAYQDAGIKVIHFPMYDNSLIDLKNKVPQAADIISNVLKTHKRVYVHCNAGKIRSPNAVIYLYWKYKGMSLKNAQDLVKSQRLKTKVIENIYE